MLPPWLAGPALGQSPFGLAGARAALKTSNELIYIDNQHTALI